MHYKSLAAFLFVAHAGVSFSCVPCFGPEDNVVIHRCEDQYNRKPLINSAENIFPGSAKAYHHIAKVIMVSGCAACDRILKNLPASSR